jgi:hypothetical protein
VKLGGPLRFGFGWLTNFKSEESQAVHHRALLDLIEILSAEGIADPDACFPAWLFTVVCAQLSFCFHTSRSPARSVGICGGIPGDWETKPTYRQAPIDVLHLAGTRDEFYTPERVQDYERQLKTRARSVQFKSYDAAHDFVPEMRPDVVQWLIQTADEH